MFWSELRFNDFSGRDQRFGQGANCQDFNVNDFVAAIEINGKQVFAIELAELGSD